MMANVRVPKLENVNVLFADDSPDTLELMKYMANSLGWRGDYVNSVSGIIEAINLNCVGEKRPYDAIVADVNYFNTQPGPRLTGITAARSIRKVRPDVPILFVSAYVDSIMREEARRVNAEIISKPVDLDLLFDRISQLIYWHRLAISGSYEGKDRRISSLNHTNYQRRATDQPVETPKILAKVLEEIRGTENERRKTTGRNE